MLRRRRRKSRLRQLADSNGLDAFVLVAIGFNCVVMAFPPKMISRGDRPTDFFCQADFVLNLIFLLEFLIKFGAYQFAYFQDSWNLLDFIVVCQGVIAIFSECPNESNHISIPLGDISALRMVRILRPLKSLRKFPEMRLLVTSLFGSFSLLLAITVLTAMAIFVMSTFASVYFRDSLDFRCLPDPYYDPFSGTFAANPSVFNSSAGPATIDVPSPTYWASREEYAGYEDKIRDDQDARRRQNRFLATNFWKSAAMYRDYARDGAPYSATFPYFASFCGGCKTCRRCDKCYSDNPEDDCELTIEGDFFRRYGHPDRIRAGFHGDDIPATQITELDPVGGVVSLVTAPLQLRGAPVPYNGSVYLARANLPNVMYIREYCVDTKKGSTAEFITRNSTTEDIGPQYAEVSSPDQTYLDLGWQVLTRFTSRFDLSEPQFEIEKLLFRLKNCENDRRKAKDAFARLNELLPNIFTDDERVNAKSCRRTYAGKTGERRFGILGRALPRRRRYLWYHQFDKSLWSLLAIFDVMNMENWNDAMWSIQMSVGRYLWPFFYAVIAIVNVCLLNLFPAVMSFNLRKAIREEENRNALDAKLAFMGADLLSMTQFEEHMIDILAAEEEEVARVRGYLSAQHGKTTGTPTNEPRPLIQEVEPLDDVPLVPRGQFFETLRRIVNAEAGPFNIFIYVCIIVNVVILSQYRLHSSNPMDRRLNLAFDTMNFIFVIIFGVEILVKNIALGPVAYIRDNYNKIDFILGILGIVDIAGTFSERSSVFSLLRIVRVTRVARVFRLAGISKIHAADANASGDLDFFRLMSIISLSSTWIFNILGLLFLVLYTASIISMQIFGNEVYSLNDYSGQWREKGRLNFDTFPLAFITNFIVITGDEWNTIMYNTMRRSGSVACIFFIVLIVIGRYAILSMLTAIIFEEVERDSIAVIKQRVRTTMLSVFKFEHAMMNSIYRYYFFKWYSFSKARDQVDLGKHSAIGQVTLMAPPAPPKTRWQRLLENPKSYFIFPDPALEIDKDGNLKPTPLGRFRKTMLRIGHSAIFANLIFATIMTSIILLATFYQIRNSSRRTSFIQVQESRPTLRAIQGLCVAIFVSEFIIMTIAETLLGYLSNPMNMLDATVTALSVISVFHTPLSPFAVARVVRIIRPLKTLARRSPAVMSILSALESSAKGVFAVGMLALFLWLTIAVCGLQLFQGRLFYCSASRYPEGGLLKAFKPDRLRFDKGSSAYDNWPDEQFTYVNERFESQVTFPPHRAANNSRGCKLFFPIEYEQYNRNDRIVDAVGTFRIKRSRYNFDNLYEAFKSAFLVFSFDDWHKLILATMNAKTTGAYLNHQAEASTTLPSIFFFIAGCSSFLLTTLFVGVIYGTFTYRMLVTQHSKKKKRLASLKDIQWRVYELKLDCIKALQEPQNPNSTNVVLRNLYFMFRHRYYKFVYAILIFGDVLVWWIFVGSQARLVPRDAQRNSIRDDGLTPALRALRTADHYFCGLLIAECILKLSTFGWFTMLALVTEQARVILHIPIIVFLGLELSGTWNRLREIDINRGCDDDSDENDPHTCDGGALQRFIYALRTTQVFLVVPAFVELRTIVYALYAALGTTLPMLLLMVISTFAFAVVGMMFLGEVDISKHNDADDPEIFGSHWFLTRLKFRTINKSMNTLFIAATANNWISIKDHFERELAPMEKGPNVIFWLLHVLIVRYVFLNVCTMIFIYKYESTSPVQPWIAMQQVEEFLRAWQQFDEFGVGRIRTKYLSRLLRLLSPPLGMTRDAPQLLADRHAKRILMAIPLLLESEIENGEPDLDARWKEIEYNLVGSHQPGHPRHNPSQLEPARSSLLPRYLEFSAVIKAVHRVVIFAELQALPDDDVFTTKREFAQAKLDILRLAVHRFCDAQHRQSSSAPAAQRAEPAVHDMSLMQRLCPDVFRYRMRQALTLETHRWQTQIKLSKFDQESFSECELLVKVVSEEKAAAQTQLAVLDTLAAKGALNALQERRPRLHRHIAFLGVLLQKITNERKEHVRKAWLAHSIVHCGTLPAAPPHHHGKSSKVDKKNAAGGRVVSDMATSKAGDLMVSAHGGNTITVWKLRRQVNADETHHHHHHHHADTKAEEDPWSTSQYFKAQVIDETERVLVVAMTSDGRRFYASSGNNIKSFVRVKKTRGQKGIRFNRESVMIGHTAQINALTISSRFVFSVSDDGSIKMWRLRSSDAQQSATIALTQRCVSMCVLNTGRTRHEMDHYGWHAMVGLDSGSLSLLPFSLNSQWLQGAVWRPKYDHPVFDDHEPITAMCYAYRRVYCGGATGRIVVLRVVRGDEDLATLEATAKELEREGLSFKNLSKAQARSGPERSRTAAILTQIVRLEVMYRMSCHTQAISGFCMAGYLFFSCSRDLSIVAWQRPTQSVVHAVQAAGTLAVGGADEQHLIMSYVSHRAPVTCITVAGDFLATADTDGRILLHRAEKYHEIVESQQSSSAVSMEKLEVEVIEKPPFFSVVDLSKVKPRHFLAQILHHYYPTKPLMKPSKKAKEADEPSDFKEEEKEEEDLAGEPDDEQLDDDFADVAGEDEFDEEFDEDEGEYDEEEDYEDDEEDYEEVGDEDEDYEDDYDEIGDEEEEDEEGEYEDDTQ
ncbi:hypothetical protein CTAYLR_008401 [Chrysophaeum taylorii]|uniref:Ion transport domain-containing protein n=1 Tax=Chrysophaeum taylorii TaxID=2483200 RepID=A0AAD7XKJ5_9STRA|nr:hypothetical protein CTAYLR_008401 [Chrysophaeum taylorii]